MRRPRSPGVLYAALVMTLLVLIGIVALTQRAPPPPTIAEFAPQAVDQITDTPSDQSSTSGTGNGECAAGQTCGVGKGGGGTATAAPVNVARVHKCVGDPPRQIEDPQSPPCVPYWSGDNGGATWRGVTRDSITVGWVHQGRGDSDQVNEEAMALERFFNSRFEFYGRKLRLFTIYSTDGSPAGQQALAQSVADQSQAFASTQHTDQGGWAYHNALARLGVVSNFGFEANPSERDLALWAPYLWSYAMASDRMQVNLARWYCARLNGRPASHAGSPVLAAAQRKIGILYRPWDTAQNTSTEPIETALRACGVVPFVVRDELNNAGNNSTLVARFQDQGVTSVLCLCFFIYWQIFTSSATSQGYFPEWLLSTFGGLDTNWGFHFGQPSPPQAEHAFGLTFQPRQVRMADDPMWWGWREGDPIADGPRTTIDVYQGHLLYRSLLHIMAGLQMAGPRLTPETFERGLLRTRFPNPDTSIYAGHVGFEGGSHAMTIDAAEYWYDPKAQSPYAMFGDGVGSICYVDRGVRRSGTGWPAGQDSLFTGPCDSGA